jgi:hypothetical protein
MEEIEKRIAELLTEALNLRSESSMPYSEASPQVVLNSLLDNRQRVDRLEGIYLQVIQIRARLSRKTSAVKAEAEDSWAEALASMKSQGSRNRDQYEGPRERYAEADLATLELKRKARKAEELLGVAVEADDVIKTALRGLNEVIQDHRIWLRSLQFQTYLEK